MTHKELQAHKALLSDLRSRINPQYEHVIGTESYERRQCAEAIEALLDEVEKPITSLAENPETTGVGAWCAPGPAANQRKTWLLVFEDRDRGSIPFDDEDAAYAMFAKAEAGGWNCHLFEVSPRVCKGGDNA